MDSAGCVSCCSPSRCPSASRAAGRAEHRGPLRRLWCTWEKPMQQQRPRTAKNKEMNKIIKITPSILTKEHSYQSLKGDKIWDLSIWPDGHESEQALGAGDWNGILAWCSPWGHKESDMTEATELTWMGGMGLANPGSAVHAQVPLWALLSSSPAEQTLFSVPCRSFMWIICVAAVVFYHQILSFLRAEKNVFVFIYDYLVCLPGKMS